MQLHHDGTHRFFSMNSKFKEARSWQWRRIDVRSIKVGSFRKKILVQQITNRKLQKNKNKWKSYCQRSFLLSIHFYGKSSSSLEHARDLFNFTLISPRQVILGAHEQYTQRHSGPGSSVELNIPGDLLSYFYRSCYAHNGRSSGGSVAPELSVWQFPF